ncbi:hypothetical protein L1987_61549 [Smallanthus sonchifolius]|uniref:Uncharacterized protein n=1 Tax=Smallanthus sonchifolius TaxID=185202 RepID=A0ACB9C7X5_9ASTR|nr:hypothetical protein L1987_61549 [Smallanthus sonchifolius]
MQIVLLTETAIFCPSSCMNLIAEMEQKKKEPEESSEEEGVLMGFRADKPISIFNSKLVLLIVKVKIYWIISSRGDVVQVDTWVAPNGKNGMLRD